MFRGAINQDEEVKREGWSWKVSPGKGPWSREGEDGVPADGWGRAHWAEGRARAKALRRGIHGWIPGKESREAAELVL